MKHKIFTIYIFIILASCLLISLFHQDIKFSEDENRYLAEKPKLSVNKVLDGSYEKEFDTYVSDQFALRNLAISLKTEIQKAILQEDNGRVYFADDDYYIDKLNIKQLPESACRLSL